LIEIDPVHARKIRRLFDPYAYHGHTLDSLREQLIKEGIIYIDSCAKFPRSKLHTILKDRAHLGDAV
jgi:hypothetical protein